MATKAKTSADENCAPKVKDEFSRRELLKRAAVLGAAATLPVSVLPVSVLEEALAQVETARSLPPLTSDEFATVQAIVGRLIPNDGNGPGAIETGADRYILRSLGGALKSSAKAYSSGLAALNRYLQASKGAVFTQLNPTQQDAVLSEIEKGAAPGFAESSAFFSMVRAHTIEGMFGDPTYGGNGNFAGWDLIGYPGVRTIVSAEEQRTDAKLAPTHKSAYDHSMFSKKGL